MKIDAKRIFGKGKRPKKPKKGNRKGIRIKPGVWKLKVLKKKCPYPIRFHVRGAQKGKGIFKGKKGKKLVVTSPKFWRLRVFSKRKILSTARILVM